MFQTVKHTVISLLSFIFAAVVFTAGSGALTAHHPPGFQNAGGISSIPATRFSFESEYRKGERGNRNSLVSVAGAEVSFLDGMLAWNFRAGMIHFAQKGAPDSARFSRVRTGIRFRPFLSNRWLLVFDTDAGLPAAGSDMIDEPFYDFSAGLTAGYLSESFSAFIRAGGLFPVGKLPQKNTEQIEFYRQFRPWETPPSTVNRQDYRLTKSTNITARLAYRLGWFEPFAGVAYRIPYAGVLIEKGAGDLRYYREYEAGLGILAGSSWYISLSYRKPVGKIEDRTLERYLYRQAGFQPRPQQSKLLDESYFFTVLFTL